MPPRRRPALTVDVASPRGAAARDAGGAGPPGHAGVRASVQLSFCDDGRLKLPGGAGGAACQITERDVRLLSVLGRGASAVVHRGELLPARTPVAVKRVVAADAAARAQVLRDVAALATPPGTAPPPGLVPLLGAYAEGGGGRVALVLALMDGGSLADAIVRAEGRGLPEPVLGAVACGVVAGLNYIHGVKRMVHRDIKPANVLLDARGRALLADFGVAAAVGDGSVAACTTFLGTAAYLAPERARGGAYSFPADVWALGLTLLEAATGSYPYDSSGGPLALLLALADDAPPRLVGGACDGGGHAYSDDLRDFIAACLTKDPAARPTAAALARHPLIARWRDSAEGGANDAPSAPPLPLSSEKTGTRQLSPRLGRVTAAAARSRSPSPDDGDTRGEPSSLPVDASPPPTARCSSPRLTDAGANLAPLSPSLTTAATAVAHALFDARRHPTSDARRAALAPLYDARASLTLEGRPPLYGARDVVAALDAAAAGAATLGGGAPRVAAVDVLPLPAGGALVLATGTVPAPGPGPLAAARGGGAAAARPARAYCDALTLAASRGGGGWRIVAHVCRTQF